MAQKALMYNPKLVWVIEVCLFMEEGRCGEISVAFFVEVVAPERRNIEPF
jgi:hypothetical protein